MENAETSHIESLPNGHVLFPTASETFTDGSVQQDGEAMDTTPDHSQNPLPANGLPVPPAATPEPAAQLASSPNFTSASAELPDIISNGDAVDAGEPMDTTHNDDAPNPPNPTIPSTENPPVPLQEQYSYSSPPPLPPGLDLIGSAPGGDTVVVEERPPNIPHPAAPPPHDDDTSSSSDEGDREERLERVEDTSVPNEEEIKEIEEAGPERSGLDRKFCFFFFPHSPRFSIPL